MILYTIGFSKKTAKYFFELLRKKGVKTLIDIRRNPHSQLSGFAKAKDLEFFIKELINGKYIYFSNNNLVVDFRYENKDDNNEKMIFERILTTFEFTKSSR